MSLEFRGKIKVGNVNLELIFIKTVFKSMEIDRIIHGGGGGHRKKKGTQMEVRDPNFSKLDGRSDITLRSDQ